ncbi:MAG: MFS transporter, partial [Bacilli bacterium]
MSNHNILTFARRYPLVWRLWLSRVFAANADGIGQFAIQWLATTFPNPAIALAYANTFGRIGMVLSSYLVGWLSDSIPPIILMVSGNLFGALFTIGMGLLLNRVHSLLLLLVLVMLWNSFTIITRTVDRTDLPRVNAWMGAIQPIQQFLAKGFAGIMIATGLFHAFLAAGIVMLVSTVPLATKHSWPKPVRRTTTSIHILSGMRVVWSMRRLRQMVVYTSVQNFGFSFFLAEYILYLKATERLSAAQIGVALSIATLGAVLSLMLGPRLLQNRLQW